MYLFDLMSSLGRKRPFSAKTVTGKGDSYGAFALSLQKLTDMLPDGRMHVEVRGSQLALVIGWNGEKIANPLKPISLDMTSGAKMVVLNKTPDGTPFYSVLQSDDANTSNEVFDDKTSNNILGDKTSNEVPDGKTSNLTNFPTQGCDGEAPLLTPNSSLLTNQQAMVRSVKAFIAKHFLLRFNLLTLQTECAKIDEVDAQGHHIYYKVDTRMINSMTEDAIEAGVNCWNQDISRSVNSNKIATYHPFHEYFNNLPEWDGVDRVTPLAQQLSSKSFIVKALHRWMLATTAQWMGFGDPDYANSIAPLLISQKQGWGKSTFCRSLMPKELSRYYTDSYDLNANAAAEQKLTTFGLINLDEFDKLPSSKMAVLKNLMQKPTTNIRRPYKQTYEQLPRIASFIGTSNRKDLLFDKTGSRRFICIELEKPIGFSGISDPKVSRAPNNPNDPKNSRLSLAQLYAQLKAELLSGERYWFSKEEEAEIQEHNKQYYHTSPAEEVFAETYRQPESSDDHVLELSAANIYERLRKLHPKAMQSISSTAFARLMPTLAAVEHTRYGNVYRVVEV